MFTEGINPPETVKIKKSILLEAIISLIKYKSRQTPCFHLTVVTCLVPILKYQLQTEPVIYNSYSDILPAQISLYLILKTFVI